jgi:pilus assembly protein Flp/PilA
VIRGKVSPGRKSFVPGLHCFIKFNNHLGTVFEQSGFLGRWQALRGFDLSSFNLQLKVDTPLYWRTIHSRTIVPIVRSYFLYEGGLPNRFHLQEGYSNLSLGGLFCPASNSAFCVIATNGFGNSSMLLDKIKRFISEEDGPTAIEYAVILASIIAVSVGAFVALSNATRGSFDRSAKAIEQSLGT